jgi:hypothetical protein
VSFLFFILISFFVCSLRLTFIDYIGGVFRSLVVCFFFSISHCNVLSSKRLLFGPIKLSWMKSFSGSLYCQKLVKCQPFSGLL